MQQNRAGNPKARSGRGERHNGYASSLGSGRRRGEMRRKRRRKKAVMKWGDENRRKKMMMEGVMTRAQKRNGREVR